MDSLAALVFALWVAAQLLAVIFFKRLIGDQQTNRREERRLEQIPAAKTINFKAAKL